jgi:septal ring factor EnvC (AmiA/AmiB activator)
MNGSPESTKPFNGVARKQESPTIVKIELLLASIMTAYTIIAALTGGAFGFGASTSQQQAILADLQASVTEIKQDYARKAEVGLQYQNLEDKISGLQEQLRHTNETLDRLENRLEGAR